MLEDIKVPEGMNKEVLEHLMHPKNYGKLENPSGVGVALDEKTKEYVIFYILLVDEKLQELRFATNGCQDTVVVGSMLSEMLEHNSIEYAQIAMGKLEEKLGKISHQQQLCANIVLGAFSAACINAKNRTDGIDEELHLLKMQESCETNDSVTQ
jgi:nitrogen fixation NifU-like protein